MPPRNRLCYLIGTLIGAVFVLVYRGPFWQFVRGYAGDWLIVQFLYLIARFWIGVRRRYWLAAGIFVLSILVEVIQYLGAGVIPRNFLTEITIGSTLDPLDILAYAVGLVTVLLIEQVSLARLKPHEG